ncbi:MAG: antitoxin Xre/MbcA/ParS toxin-binding domain-containing protein [Gemmatimonadales bacterium]
MTSPAFKIAAILGGRPVLKRTVTSESDLVEAVRRGLPTAAVEWMVREDLLSKEEVYALIAPKRTYQLRRQQHKPLTAAESEKAARIARIFALAIEAFQDPAKAATWLRRPSRVLGREPLSLLESESGARLVEEELLRITWGFDA